MAEPLLAGVRVVDLAGEPAAMTGRILADLGAAVTRVEPPGGDGLRQVPPFGPDGRSLRAVVWHAGKTVLELDGSDPRLAELLAGADVVLATPGTFHRRRPRMRSGSTSPPSVATGPGPGGRPATSG